MSQSKDLQRILVIRRDNIGDLVCTTPLLRALRQQLPAARIEVLATKYNQAVLKNNPDIDALHFYVKAKHREKGEGVLGIYWQRLRMLWQLRRRCFDLVLIAGGRTPSAMRLARMVAARQVVWFDAETGRPEANEVEHCCRLLSLIGLEYSTPAPVVVANKDTVVDLQARFAIPSTDAIVGIHISARKISQRWPARSFIDLIQALHSRFPQIKVMLLWAPGSHTNPLHPGDDEKAAEILAATKNVPVYPVSTTKLDELIAALSLCDRVICADGGAMHLAAGLGKPIVCFFGQSDRQRWHPWGVPFELLQPDSQEVGDISVVQALNAFERLSKRLVFSGG